MEIRAAARAGREPDGLGALPRREERELGERALRDRAARRQAVLRLPPRQRVHGLTRDAEVVVGPARADTFDGEQLLLQRDPVAGVAGQIAGGPDHPVARDNDRQRVPAERLGHGARGRRPAELARDAGVGAHRAVRDLRRRVEHRAMKGAPRQAQIERPAEPAAPAVQVFEEVAVERLDLSAVLDRLDAREVREARMPEVAPAGEVLDPGDTLLGTGDQDRAERRREDAVHEGAAPEVGEPDLEARARRLLGGRGRPAPRADDAADRAVAREIPAAGYAGAGMRLDARRRRAVRVTDRGREERGFDLYAHGRLARHFSSPPGGSSKPFRLRRILRRAWNTWARALSWEHSRLRPMAS